MSNPHAAPAAEAVVMDVKNAVHDDHDPLLVPEIAGSYDIQILIRRAIGAIVDYATLFSFHLVPSVVLGTELHQKTSLLWMSLCVAYFPLTEGLTGRSLGKVISRTRVVDKQCRVPGIVSSVVRTLFRVIEVNPLVAGGLPAAVVAALSKTNGRLGDIVAGTYVITEADFRRVTAKTWHERENSLADTCRSI